LAGFSLKAKATGCIPTSIELGLTEFQNAGNTNPFILKNISFSIAAASNVENPETNLYNQLHAVFWKIYDLLNAIKRDDDQDAESEFSDGDLSDSVSGVKQRVPRVQKTSAMFAIPITSQKTIVPISSLADFIKYIHSLISTGKGFAYKPNTKPKKQAADKGTVHLELNVMFATNLELSGQSQRFRGSMSTIRILLPHIESKETGRKAQNVRQGQARSRERDVAGKVDALWSDTTEDWIYFKALCTVQRQQVITYIANDLNETEYDTWMANPTSSESNSLLNDIEWRTFMYAEDAWDGGDAPTKNTHSALSKPPTKTKTASGGQTSDLMQMMQLRWSREDELQKRKTETAAAAAAAAVADPAVVSAVLGLHTARFLLSSTLLRLYKQLRYRLMVKAAGPGDKNFEPRDEENYRESSTLEETSGVLPPAEQLAVLMLDFEQGKDSKALVLIKSLGTQEATTGDQPVEWQQFATACANNMITLAKSIENYNRDRDSATKVHPAAIILVKLCLQNKDDDY